MLALKMCCWQQFYIFKFIINRKPPSLLFSFTRPPSVKNSSPSRFALRWYVFTRVVWWLRTGTRVVFLLYYFWWHPIFPTANYSDGPLFQRPIIPTNYYPIKYPSVHKITLKTVSLVERWNPQFDKLGHFLSDRSTPPLCMTCLMRLFFTSIRRAIGRWLCRKKSNYWK